MKRPKTSKAINILFGLKQRYDAYSAVRGEKWKESVAAYKPHLDRRANEDNCSIIEAALTLGKMLSDGGHDPNELFAVAYYLEMEASDG